MLAKAAVLGGVFLAAMALAGVACSAATPTPPPSPTPGEVEERELTPEELRDISFATGEWPWETNFKKYTVPYSEFLAGGPLPDGIPPLDSPKFLSVAQVDWLNPLEPVISFELRGDARAYPMQILIWHEIVNDVVAGAPVAVTFCPLCNLALVFDRRVDGEVLDFGTTGLLRYSDLVMWDRQTQSWWQQATGEAVAGHYAGTRLAQLPAAIVSWEAFARAFPRGKVLSRDTGFSRRYGENPYIGYDSTDEPFLFVGPKDDRLHPMERVVAVNIKGRDVAYPFSVLAKTPVVHDRVGGQPLVVFYQPGTRSALDSPFLSQSRDVGAAAIYDPILEGRQLTLQASGNGFVDDQAGSSWNLLGQATAGPLEGKRLTPIPHGTHFWFAWAAFVPDAAIYGITRR